MKKVTSTWQKVVFGALFVVLGFALNHAYDLGKEANEILFSGNKGMKVVNVKASEEKTEDETKNETKKSLFERFLYAKAMREVKYGATLRPVKENIITQEFAPEKEGIFKHNGLDFKANVGTTVASPLDAQVIDVFDECIYPDRTCLRDGKPYPQGNTVRVEDRFGNIFTFAHLELATVEVGDLIYAGQTIGISGDSGMTNGAHLHVDIQTKHGIVLDPTFLTTLPFLTELEEKEFKKKIERISRSHNQQNHQ